MIYDGDLREPFLGELTVVGDTIESVVEYEVPRRVLAPNSEKETVVDCGGDFLMPGLVEGHAHLTFADSFDNKSIPHEEHSHVTVSRFSPHAPTPCFSSALC
jgi:imidazolonepropionase-like amidohydrolase